MEKKLKIIDIKTTSNGILNLSKIKSIKRIGKPNIFSKKMKKNITKYLFDFLYYNELLTINSTNVFIHNCLSDYDILSWDVELRNIIDIFNLDIHNINEEMGGTLASCIAKNRLYKMKNYEGNYIKINNEGINIISSVYFDSDMQSQLDKLNNNINKNSNFSFNSFGSFDLFENYEENNKINPYTLKTPWKTIQCDNSYNGGNIIYLEEKSALDFGFSFNNVIRGNYKFYLHQSITNMKNAKLILQITINNHLVYEINDFPNSTILEQFNDNNNNGIIKLNNLNNSFDDISFSEEEDDNNQNINLKETFICEIKEEMFDKINNNLKKKTSFESKNTFDSLGSTESNTSNTSNKSNEKILNSRIKKYTIRIRFTNQHLLWKAGWYLDGGKLVRDMGNI